MLLFALAHFELAIASAAGRILQLWPLPAPAPADAG